MRMIVDNYNELWEKVLVHIEMEISSANFKTWFKDTFIIDFYNNVIELGVPNKIVKDWLAHKYHTFILKTINEFDANIKNIEYTIAKKPKQKTNTLKKDSEEEEEKIVKLPITHKMSVSKNDNLNPKYTFDTFIVGKFNQLAHAAANAVIENPGITYNPLFIYGSTGHGKTHLIQAVGNQLKSKIEDYKVFYVTAEKFTVDYVNAIKAGKGNIFKDKYRRYDLLIMDDVQFIAEKDGTQEELFHLFNAMHDHNKQIVFSSDKHPNQIPGFAERLKSRFSAGMIAEIPTPDIESRIEILKAKANFQNADIDYEIINFIAKELVGNIRELEGILNNVIIQTKVKGSKLNEKEVLEIIKQLSKPVQNLGPKSVMEKITDFYGINIDDVKKKTRKKEIVHPRQVIMYILREDLDISFPTIGEHLGGRDHTTVIHSYEKVKKSIETDPVLEREIEEIRELLKHK
jgi:chromosomal replication initiator protein